MTQIKEARLAAGLKQTEVAREMGVSSAAVCHWEQGLSMPASGKLVQLSELLGTTVNELLKGTEERK